MIFPFRRSPRLSAKELGRIEMEITSGAIEARKLLAMDHRPRVEADYNHYKVKMADATTQYVKRYVPWLGDRVPEVPVEDKLHRRSCFFYSLQGYGIIAVDAVVAVLLALDYWRGPRQVAMAIGVIVALVLAGVGKTIAKHKYSESAPRPSVIQIKDWTSTLGWIVMFISAFFALTRTTRFAEVSFEIVTVAIGFVLPLLGGAYLQLSAMHRELNDPFDEYTSNAAAFARIERVYESIVTILVSTPALPIPEGAQQDGEGHADASIRSRVPIATALIFAVFLGSLASQATAGSTVPVTARLYPDISGSLDESVTDSLLEGEIVATLLSIPHLENIEIFPFAISRDVSRLKPAFRLKVDLEDPATICRQPTKAEERLRGAWEVYERECQKQRMQSQKRNESHRRQLDARLSRALRIFFTQEPKPQSCIHQIIGRALAEPATVINIIITDGKQEACPYPKDRIEPFFGSRGGARTLVILVPDKRDTDQIAGVEQHMRELQRRAPSVTVIPYLQAPQRLAELLVGTQSGQ
jgi:hypothetical protein